MSDKYTYTTEDTALEALYAMPTGAIVAHEYTMYSKIDGAENRWVTAEDDRELTAEDVVERGLPLERIDLDPEVAAAMEDEAEYKAQAAEAKSEAYGF